MGLKSLRVATMIPWCLHLVGASARTSPTPNGAGVRVVAYDGRVKVYHRPVTAAEVMKDHPCHLVCRSDAFFIGQKVPPVAAGAHLQPGQIYFLFPSHFFHSVLSFVTLAASLVGPGGKGAAAVRPFDIRKTTSGTLQITLSDGFLREREPDEKQSRSKGVVTTDALEKEYKMLVRCKSRQWAPKLETIRESERGRPRIEIEPFKRRRKKESHRPMSSRS